MSTVTFKEITNTDKRLVFAQCHNVKLIISIDDSYINLIDHKVEINVKDALSDYIESYGGINPMYIYKSKTDSEYQTDGTYYLPELAIVLMSRANPRNGLHCIQIAHAFSQSTWKDDSRTLIIASNSEYRKQNLYIVERLSLLNDLNEYRLPHEYYTIDHQISNVDNKMYDKITMAIQKQYKNHKNIYDCDLNMLKSIINETIYSKYDPIRKLRKQLYGMSYTSNT